MSPYMMPNKKGNVTTANKAGFASWYRGTPYVSTSSWKDPMNSDFLKCVGGFTDPAATESSETNVALTRMAPTDNGGGVARIRLISASSEAGNQQSARDVK